MPEDAPSKQLPAWVGQLSAIIFVLGAVFTAGGLYRGLMDLQEWRVQATARAEAYDVRLRGVESLHASTQADLAAIKQSLARIERHIDTGRP